MQSSNGVFWRRTLEELSAYESELAPLYDSLSTGFFSQFIQPQGQAPKTTLTLVIPPMDVNFLCPLTFYLRQNLSQLLFSPRYMDSDPSHHFKAVSGRKTEATGCANGESSRLQPEIYLYNRPHSSGGKGGRSRYWPLTNPIARAVLGNIGPKSWQYKNNRTMIVYYFFRLSKTNNTWHIIETVFTASSRPRKNQSQRSDLPQDYLSW